MRALWLTVLIATRALAQVGSTTDIIMGKVTSPDGQPVVGAIVTVTSLSGNIVRQKETSSNGHYSVLFPDGGGQYRVEIRSVGFAPATVLVIRQADEDRLVADVELKTNVPVLSTVTTRAQRNQRGDAANAGSTGLTLTPAQIEKLPIDGSDLATIAALAPGVVALSSTDTTDAQFSVAGQRPTLNNTTVDGISFGGTSVPTEATRRIRVITNSYDVARGQFTGGQVATTTRGGSNDFQGSFGAQMRSPDFAFGQQGPTAFGQLRNQLQFSGGFGGPIVLNKLFSYTAGQFNRRYDDLISLLNVDPSTLGQLGISPDTAALFINQVRKLGLPTTTANVPGIRGTNTGVFFQRFDWLASDDETIMLRFDWRATAQDGARISALTLPTTGTAGSNAGGGVMLTLTSHLGDGVINEFRAYATHAQTSSDPYLSIPAGRVTFVPDEGDTSDVQSVTNFGVSSLSFGGSPGVATHTHKDFIESTDEVSLLSPGGGHRMKLGWLMHLARFGQSVTPNQEGTYGFQTFGQFLADSPATFTRELGVRSSEARTYAGALYLGDAWRAGTLQLTYGARLEGNLESGAPPLDPQIYTLFGRRTDQWPGEIHASPRVGFQWLIGSLNGNREQEGGGKARTFNAPLVTLRGGFGEFRAPVPQSLYSSLQSATGLAGAESQLVCVGPQVPPPDWEGYTNGTGSPPTTCVGGAFPPDTLGLGARSTVTTFAPDFEAPRAWRGSLGATRRLTSHLSVAVDASYARGVTLFGVTDLNLNTRPAFTIPNEDHRPVFVSSTSVDPATGGAAFGSSRLHNQFGEVLSLNSNLGSETKQLTANLSGFTDRGVTYTLAYTYSNVRDQSSFSGGSAAGGYISAPTAGNPNALPWTTSDLQRTHAFVGTLIFPFSQLVELTSTAQLSSGAPFTPIVNGDVNGDGSGRNDRAFVFDPTNPATASKVAAGMRTLLSTGSSSVRDCLKSQIGTIAGRNTCDGPWSTSLNWQLNIRPNWAGLDRRLTLSLMALNSLTGIDLLLHGENHLQGWGQPKPPDPVLLTVTGFNPGTHEFDYTVNTHFGRATAFQPYGIPFQFVIALRFNVGATDAQQQIRSMFGGGFRRKGGGAAPSATLSDAHQSFADEMANRLGQRIPNPFMQVLRLADSLTLVLSQDQVTQLDTLANAFQTKADSLREVVRKNIGNLGANVDQQTMAGVLRKQFTVIRAMNHQALQDLQTVLTAVQYAKLPQWITGGGGRRPKP
ncbi:MAG TPA: carboxypeptidase regulatory-like domain-containing protein [Gemmatimonadaceae bacterium]|nr:carboxypeptidase regulatory-like domain-containing protein [Gemmatimonadaceae bacterium]